MLYQFFWSSKRRQDVFSRWVKRTFSSVYVCSPDGFPFWWQEDDGLLSSSFVHRYTYRETIRFHFILFSRFSHITKNRSRICHSVEFILTVYTQAYSICVLINLSLSPSSSQSFLSLEVIEWISLTLLFTRWSDQMNERGIVRTYTTMHYGYTALEIRVQRRKREKAIQSKSIRGKTPRLLLRLRVVCSWIKRMAGGFCCVALQNRETEILFVHTKHGYTRQEMGNHFTLPLIRKARRKREESAIRHIGI